MRLTVNIVHDHDDKHKWRRLPTSTTSQPPALGTLFNAPSQDQPLK